MLTFLVLSAMAFGAIVVLATIVVLIKPVLLPLRLAFSLIKLLAVLAVGAVLLVVGLPIFLILFLPLIFLGLIAWGAARLLAA